MPRALLLGGFALAVLPAIASAQTYYKGYTRQDGTYVAPHYQSQRDSSYNNNWSISPNVNPYTGQQGTRAPTSNDRPPTSSFGNTYSNPYRTQR